MFGFGFLVSGFGFRFSRVQCTVFSFQTPSQHAARPFSSCGAEPQQSKKAAVVPFFFRLQIAPRAFVFVAP
jgi:hypothetical protein